MYPILFSIGSLNIRANTTFFILGCLAGLWVGKQEAQLVGYTNKQILRFFAGFLPFAYLAGMINAWLFNIGSILHHPSWQKLLFSGWVSYGGILGALLFVLIYPRIRKDDSGKTMDIVALILPLFEGFYRIGCLLNGCCYGRETEGFGGLYLPNSYGQWAVRYPTQMLYILLGFGLFILLWQTRKKKGFEGELAARYLILYGIGRFAVDGLRANMTDLGWINVHQAADLVLLMVGLAGWGLMFIKKQGKQ